MTITASETLEVTVKCELAGREMTLSVSPRKTVRDVLRVSAARFHVLGDDGGIGELQIRRDGETQPLDLDAPAGDALAEGDQLIVEAISNSGAAAPATEPQQADLSAAASRAAAESLSNDSRTFLEHARQTRGE